MSSDDQQRSWLDGVDTAASTLYIVLLAVIAGAVLGALLYVVTNWPAGFGWGSQGEAFYLGVAFLLVIGWIMGQLTWIMRRRQRRSWTFGDGSELPLPKVDVNDSGVSIKWGKGDRENPAKGSHTWSWNIPISRGATRTFRLDQQALDAARQARAAGASWDDVCRTVNPEWDTLNALDRALFLHALEAAVRETRTASPPVSTAD